MKDEPAPSKHRTVRGESGVPQKFQPPLDWADPVTIADFYAVLRFGLEDPETEFSSWEEVVRKKCVPKADWGRASEIIQPNDGLPSICFQKIDIPKPKKNRFHIDINTTVGSPLPVSGQKKCVIAEVKHLPQIGETKQVNTKKD
jgi:hypothetical protein